MKYKVGDKVRIKSLDWYNENKDEDGNIILINCTNSSYNFIEKMRGLCGKVMTISSVYMYSYNMVEDDCEYFWTDEMIEGLVEEETKPNIIEEAKTYWDSIKDAWICPDGYIFKDENGNVINATKIVLEKKKPKFPKTYEECCKILEIDNCAYLTSDEEGYWNDYELSLNYLIEHFRKLLICRDAYWKIAGDEMGLGKPWSPTDSDYITGRYCIFVHRGNIICDTPAQDCILTFPTEEMRDTFYENFKEIIESCKELL